MNENIKTVSSLIDDITAFGINGLKMKGSISVSRIPSKVLKKLTYDEVYAGEQFLGSAENFLMSVKNLLEAAEKYRASCDKQRLYSTLYTKGKIIDFKSIVK